MKVSRSLLAFALLLLGASASLRGENWPQWRGPHFNGSSKAKDLPSSWSKNEGIAWQADLPGPSAATPVIWGDSVFVSSTDSKNKTLQAICIDRATGKVRWQTEAAVGVQRDNRSTFASPSPVTDGKQLIFFYGNGEMLAFDMAGKKLWSKNIQKEQGEFAFLWTFSTSPLLYDGKLYMQVLQRDVAVSGRGRTDGPNESYLLAMDPESGKTLWRQERPSQAVAESREAFTTPVPMELNGRRELLVIGGDDLSGHDPSTGKELWRWGTWNPNRIGHWRLVPSPVSGAGIILACAPKGDPVYAIKAGGNGQLDEAAIAWKSDRGSPLTVDVPTPAFDDGDFFILSDVKSALSRVEPKTGKIKWSLELPRRKKFEASPTVADGKVYLMNFAGDVVVVDAAMGTVLSNIAMGEESDDFTRSSVAVTDGQVFIRTNNKLFCVAKR